MAIINRVLSILGKAAILLITIYCLVVLLSGCAMQRDAYAGRINGELIKSQDFMNSLRGHFTGFRLEKDRTPDENEKKELYRQTWRNITIHVILKDHFKKHNIQVTQKEVIDSLLNKIPESVFKAPLFQRDGKFNRDLYVDTIISSTPGLLDWLKQYYFDYYIPIAKLKNELMKKDVISNKDLNNLLMILNSAADIDWIVFDPAIRQVNVTKADIESYYHSHLNEFEISPYVKLGWSALPVNLINDDILMAKAKVDSIYFELNRGKSFTNMTELFSQSTTSNTGGALGFVKLDELPEAVRMAVTDINNYQITTPIRVDDNWIIYQKIEQTRNLVKLNELVIQIIPSKKNIEGIRERAIHLRDLALQLGLETAAQEMNIKYRQTGKISKDSLWLPDPNIDKYVIDRSFTQKTGSLLEPVYSNLMQSWLIFEVLENQPFRHQPIVAVNDQIREIITEEKQKQKTLEDAKLWSTQNRSSPLNAALKEGFTVINTKANDIDGKVDSLHINSIFDEIIKSHRNKEIPKPVILGDKVLLPITSKVYTTNPPRYNIEDARRYYFSKINPKWFDNWLDNEVRKAKVKIWAPYP